MNDLPRRTSTKNKKGCIEMLPRFKIQYPMKNQYIEFLVQQSVALQHNFLFNSFNYCDTKTPPVGGGAYLLIMVRVKQAVYLSSVNK
jgi:hypothetical protein